ncbi:MAG: PAS domain S-box protein [Nitrospirae bacterium]|nr:PAS domain S-box protein [Nitrospirota bacterium]
MSTTANALTGSSEPTTMTPMADPSPSDVELLHELRESEERLWTMLETAEEGFVTLGPDSRVVSANTAAHTLFGVDYGELMGQPVTRFVPEAHREDLAFLADGDSRSRRNAPWIGRRLEWTLRGTEGNDRFVEVELSRHVTRTGEYVSMILRDVTERIRAERALKASHAELQRALEDLKRAQSALVAQERFAALGELALGVAHEVNNPLQGFKGRLQLMADDLRECLGAEHMVLKDIRLLDEQVDRIARIVQGLLTFARPSTAKRAAADLKQVIATVAELAASPVRAAGLTLDIQTDAALPTVQIDVQQVQQVILNLLQNAIQATPKGGRISARTLAQDGWAVIEVSDTGCGIPATELNKIFEPFYTTKEKGTGLGLALSRSIVIQHGGRLDAESALGKGSTFRVRIPLPEGADRS